MELLTVEWCAYIDPDTGECSSNDWRVRVNGVPWSPKGRAVIRTAFARQRDAEIGKAALLAAGLDTLEKLIESRDRLHEIMCEALQW